MRSRLLLSLMELGAVLLLALPTYGLEDDFSTLLHSARAAARAGELPAARASLESALALEPGNPDGWYELGLLLGQSADFRGAEAAFRRAIELNPERADAHYNLALTLIANPQSKLDWPAAMASCRAALKLRPDYAEALNLLGAGLSSLGEIERSISELSRAVQLKPTLAEAHFNLAMSLEQADRPAQAEGEYRAAIAARGSYPEASTALGQLLIRGHKLADAEVVLAAALRSNPDLTAAHYALARLLHAKGDQPGAAVEFDAAKELAERKSDAIEASRLSNTGLEQAAQGDQPGALAMLRRAIQLKPDYGVPHYNLGLVLADSGQLALAAEELVKAISLMPGQSKPWQNLGRVLQRLGDATQAATALAWATRLAPNDQPLRDEAQRLHAPRIADVRPAWGAAADTAAAHLAFGRELAARPDSLGAAGELLRALALEPALGDARLPLARQYGKLGDQRRSIIEYRKFLRLRQDDALIHLELGQALLKLPSTEQAIREFRKALQLRPNSAEARDALERASGSLPKP